MENISFRVSSFGGFNKDDVMQYIEKMNFDLKEIREQNETQIKRLQNEISEKDAEIERNKGEKQKIEAQNIEFQSKFEQSEQENKNLSEMVRLKTAGVDEQVRALTQEKTHLLDHVNTLEEQIFSLNEKLSLASKEKNSYDSVRDTLVKLEIDAHIRAKKMKEDAQAEAEQIVANAKQNAEQIMHQKAQEFAELSEKKEKLLQETKQAVAQVIEQSTQKFIKIQEEIASIHAINSNVCTHLNDFSQGFATILDEVTQDESVGV